MQKLEIWPTGGAGYVDYTSYLFSEGPDAPVVSREHDLNQPQQLSFSLQNGLAGFSRPEIGNRVRVTINTFSDFFTGYLSATPELTLLGGKNGQGVYGYKCAATDESQKLEWKAAAIFPTLPPFLNRTQGEIIKALITVLGGTLDVTNVAAGVLVPYFRTSTSEGFWQAVRRLIDNTQSKFWVEGGKAYFKPYDDAVFGYDAAESYPGFSPEDLDIKPVQNQIFNDVLGFGAVEPQTFCREYFVGDGLSASFALKKPVFSGNQSNLLTEDWTSGAINSSDWNLAGGFDPDNLLSAASGSLKLFGGASVSPARLTLIKGIEISGTTELRAGRFNFFQPTDAIIGALMQADTGLLADVIFGFRATKNGLNTQLRAIVNGALVGPTYTTRPGLTYQLTITVDAPQLIRTQQTFFSRDNSFGGAVVTSGANVSFLVEEVQNFGGWQPNVDYALYTKIIDYNNRLEMVTTAGKSGAIVPTWPEILNATTPDGPDTLVWEDLGPAPASGTSAPVPVIEHTAHVDTVPQWLYYMLLGGPYSSTSTNALLTVNYTYLHTPLYLELFTKPQGATSYTRERIGDKTDLSARAGVITQNGVTTVQFFQDVQPAVAEFVKIVYREAAIARARIQRATSIAAEALKAGDDGIRSGILQKLQQQPRNSAELELAIQAYIDDHTGSLYEGTWTFNSRNYTFAGKPVPGRFMTVNTPTRYPSFAALVTKVVTDFIINAGSLEFISAQATFGPLYRFDEVQQQFLNPENAAAGAADVTVQLTPVEFEDVAAAHAEDRDTVDWDGVFDASTFEMDAGDTPTKIYEVRKTDEGWGTDATVNLIESVTVQVFLIPRNAVDSAIYLRNRDTFGAVSRYAAMVRLVIPLVPSSPTAVVDTTDPRNLIITLGSEILNDPNVYGYEIRDGYGNILFRFANLALQPADLVWTLQNNSQTTLTLYVYTFNLINEYSTPDVLHVGPLVFPSNGFPTTPPGAPINITAAVQNYAIMHFDWDAPLGALVADVISYYGDIATDIDFTENVTPFGPVTATQVNIPVPPLSGPYFFRVRGKYPESDFGPYGYYTNGGADPVPIAPTPISQGDIPDLRINKNFAVEVNGVPFSDDWDARVNQVVPVQVNQPRLHRQIQTKRVQHTLTYLEVDAQFFVEAITWDDTFGSDEYTVVYAVNGVPSDPGGFYAPYQTDSKTATGLNVNVTVGVGTVGDVVEIELIAIHDGLSLSDGGQHGF